MNSKTLIFILIFLVSSAGISSSPLEAKNTNATLPSESDVITYLAQLKDWTFYIVPPLVLAAQPVMHYLDALYDFANVDQTRAINRRYLGSARAFNIQFAIGFFVALYGFRYRDILYGASGLIHIYASHLLKDLGSRYRHGEQTLLLDDVL